MDAKKIMQIFEDTAYVRTGGSPEELRAAEYIRSLVAELGLSAELESFEVPMATMKKAELYIDGVSLPCKGYLCAGSATVEAPLYYMPVTDAYSLSQCRGKIILLDSGVSYWVFHDLMENGALGYITYDGNVNFPDCDIDQKELRSYVSEGKKLPGVNINAKTAVSIVKNGGVTAKIVLEQDEYTGKSHNVVLDMPGEDDDMIILTAHYDSTSLSTGAYDNMSGCIGLIGVAEHFTTHPHRCGLRFVWCGSEERGLLGSKAYAAAHEEELKKAVLNINLDMIGSIMGKFIACCSTEEKLVHYLGYMADELGFGVAARQGVYSSDSTPFADKGVPALSFARNAPMHTATIHDSYDTLELIRAEHMIGDINFITAFTERMACARRCPVAREIPEKVREDLDIYLSRKRAKN